MYQYTPPISLKIIVAEKNKATNQVHTPGFAAFLRRRRGDLVRNPGGGARIGQQ